MMKRIALAASLALALAACQDDGFSRSATKHLTPIPSATMALMASKGMSKDDPILIRAYKKESEMEVWKRGADGKFALLKTYPICRWSGQLGPKNREGDRQVPEGFYTVTPAQMNPNSAYYLSFDTGYPNNLDRSLGRSGGDIMVHGSCTSRGCFAMTDQNVAELYAIAREAFASGQRSFQFQSFPFRMTPQNLAEHRLDPHIGFWKNLKEGSDVFEVTREEPQVAVAGGRYVFNGANLPAVAEKRQRDEQQIAELSTRVTPIKLVYHDGDTHDSFRSALASAAGADGSLAVDSRLRNRFGEISRPEGISSGPQRIALDATGRPKNEAPSTALAFASLNTPPAPEARAPAAPAAAQAGTPAAPAAPASQETPFYKRMFSGVSDLFSSSAPAQPAAATAASATPAATPLPPQRGTGAKPAPERRADAASGIRVANAN